MVQRSWLWSLQRSLQDPRSLSASAGPFFCFLTGHVLGVCHVGKWDAPTAWPSTGLPAQSQDRSLFFWGGRGGVNQAPPPVFSSQLDTCLEKFPLGWLQVMSSWQSSRWRSQLMQ